MAVNKLDNSMIDPTDIGTSANQLLKLDGTAKIPAADGSLLTGLSASFTSSASDPTISTNPSGGVGTLWKNTTSGEVYCCTNATAGANVWTNVGEGTGNIFPWAFQGTTYGYTMGGATPGVPNSNNDIERFSFTSDGNSSDVADLAVHVRYSHSACNTGTAGYCLGGHQLPSSPYVAGAKTEIQKFIFATEANATDVGDLTVQGEGQAAASSPTYGYSHAGSVPGDGGPPYQDKIEKFSFAAEGTMVDVGNLLTGVYASASGFNSLTYGYCAGGQTPGSPNLPSNVLQRWSFSSDGNATDVADLTQARSNLGASSSTTYGYAAGGNPAPKTTIDKHQFDTSNNSTDVGDLIANNYQGATQSSTNYGYVCGGGSPYHNTIQKYSFASGTQNAVDVGDILSIRYGLSGVQQ